MKKLVKIMIVVIIFISIIAIIVSSVKNLYIELFITKNENLENVNFEEENTAEDKNFNKNTNTEDEVVLNEDNAVEFRKQIDDWRLILVNSENQLPNDFSPDLVYIDKTRQIDSRVKEELEQMLKDMKKAKIGDIWVQSAYRSVEYQEKIYNEKIEEYISLGETREKAEILTLKVINKPGTSDHNLGLAIDFNYVDYNFDKTPAYEWLTQNAENYGFVLRYRKDKETITKIDYEPWHWRYVGVEHAKKMNELDMCLEEYVEYLSLN